MLILFDNGTPRTLARYLIQHHTVTEARARGWDQLENGALLTAAEASGFKVQFEFDDWHTRPPAHEIMDQMREKTADITGILAEVTAPRGARSTGKHSRSFSRR